MKFKETNIELIEKVLNVFVDVKENCTEFYVIMMDCVHCYVLEDPLARNIIKFDSMYKENLHMPVPVEKYKD